MKFKRIIVAVILLCITLSLSSCSKEVTIDGVTYMLSEDYYCIGSIKDIETNGESIYIPDAINNIPIKQLGNVGYLTLPVRILYKHTERVYFPWSISKTYGTSFGALKGKEDVLCYLISSSTECIVDISDTGSEKSVMPKKLYDNREFTKNTNRYVPANISYLFNHEGSPNRNYFFVDIIEESGKLTKPPYDPKREGYTFGGWYTEAECVNPFNFEEDSVTINFDEEGNRIYEEFCLYAKWDKK